MIGEILWEPPADLRQTTQIGRFMEFAERRCDQRFAGYDDLWRWSVQDLEGFWGSIWEFFELRAHAPVRARAGLARDAGRGVVPGRPAQLRRAPGRPRRGPRLGRGGGSLADPAGVRGDLRRAARAGGAGARRPAAARRRPRRPRRRLHAEHPRDAGGVHRHREPGRDLGRLRARSSARAASSTASRRSSPRCCWPSAATASATATSTGGRGRGDPRAAPHARARGRRALRRGDGARRGRRGRSYCARPAPLRVRAGRLRPPALRAVLLGHDRAAQGDRPRPRRPAHGAPQEPGPGLGPQARRAPAVVLHHGVDDVERAGLARCCCAPRS